MNIVLLANTEQKEELTAQQQDIPAGLIWPVELSSLENITDAAVCIDLLFDDTRERMKKLREFNAPIIVVNSVLRSPDKLTAGCIRINGWNTFLKRPVMEAFGPADLKKKAEEIFSLFNKKIEWVADITGFVSLRIVASIINEAYFALDEKISTKEEIDIAMKLGTNYPYGPFEWCQKIGIKKIYHLLSHLSEEQKRYAPSGLLINEATL